MAETPFIIYAHAQYAAIHVDFQSTQLVMEPAAKKMCVASSAAIRKIAIEGNIGKLSNPS